MIRRALARPERVTPLVALVLVVVAFACTPLRTGTPLATFDVYNALQGFAQVGLLALAIGLTMIAGEFDLSVVGTYALGGMVAVQTGQSSPLLGVLAAVGCGVGIGAVQGGLIAGLRIPSMPVTLATYIALLGLTYAMSGGLSVSYTNFDAVLWVDQTVAGIFSPRSLITLGAFLLAALVLGFTRLGPELRAVGGDRRASRVAGVRVERTLVVLFTVSGGLAALGGALLAYSFASANPDPGLRPLLIAAVAALLGGVSLAGGRGSPLGLLAGALAVALLAQVVAVSYLPDYWIQLFYAALLAVIVVVDSPGLRRGVERAPGAPPFVGRSRSGRAVMGNLTFDFSGRTVLLTGAARGVGRALGEHFRDSGAAVYLVDVDEDEVTATAKEIGAVGLAADVTDSDQVRAVVERVVSDTGRLDVLVNNAGILRDGLVWKLSDDDYESVMAVHAGGTFRFTRAAVPHFRRQGSGRIINVTSYTGIRGNPGQSNYAMAKAGIIGFTKTTAKELARFGTTVNAISPNAQTRMITSIPAAKREQLAAGIPMGRFAEASEMAAAVAFLASEEAGYITGVVFPVDGGLSL